jgi:hypothetical protein
MKIITPVTVGCIILLITVGIYSNLYIFKLFKPQIMLAGCMLPYFGYILGGLIAFVVRLPWERVKTVEQSQELLSSLRFFSLLEVYIG